MTEPTGVIKGVVPEMAMEKYALTILHVRFHYVAAFVVRTSPGHYVFRRHTRARFPMEKSLFLNGDTEPVTVGNDLQRCILVRIFNADP